MRSLLATPIMRDDPRLNHLVRRRALNSPINVPYWLNPIFIVSAVILVSLVMFALTPEGAFEREFRALKMPLWSTTYTYIFIWMTIIVGARAGMLMAGNVGPADSTYARQSLAANSLPYFKALGVTALILSLLAYLIYFALSDVSLGVVTDFLSGVDGANYEIKDSMEKIPGATSFMAEHRGGSYIYFSELWSSKGG